ncbi:MAG: PQQ-binding-like beta-propeller repeat protein [Candidatus Thermoplasmatota archaeon]|nr:PQQ-binding-like beta-propeller repeat protein [Candidatus Thermoplasmatota archaeon]
MRRPVAFVIVLLLLPTLTAALPPDVSLYSNEAVPDVSENAVNYQSGYRYNVQGLIYVHIRGNDYQRGYQHGYLLYPEIMDMLYRWSNTIHNCPLVMQFVHINQSSPRYDQISSTWWQFCRSRAVNIFWEHYPQEYKNEIRGIAEAVAARGGQMYGEPVTYEDILTLNEMYELMSMLVNPQKSIHPLRTLYHDLLGVAPELENKETQFIFSLVSDPPVHHCDGFIATGDATTHGQIVAAESVWCGGWWYSYYIAQRWNVVLDIVPSQGHRIVMGTSPGLIWSDEDYYQNEQGIILIETTSPQGLWKKDALPLAVRARKALQYGDSIDDVIDALRTDNSGIMNAPWLIGDTKTGEIARFELGLYESAVWRTTNGFYWSANNQMDASVRREQLRLESIKGALFRLAHILLNTSGYEYYTLQYTPSERDIAFEELGNQYYGNLDVGTVKRIMSMPPISDFSTDCKVSDSTLIARNGLWFHWGNPHGQIWNTSAIQPNLRGAVDVPAQGWVLMYGIQPEAPLQFTYEPGIPPGGSRLQWSYDLGDTNEVSASGVVSDNMLYMASVNGTVAAFDRHTGTLQWERRVGLQAVQPTWAGDTLLVGSRDGLTALDGTGVILWKSNREVAARPVVHGDRVIAGSSDGRLSCYALRDGEEIWARSLNGSAYPSWPVDKKIYVGAGTTLYCLRAESGETVWEYTTGGEITAAPVADRDDVYVGSWDHTVHALDARSGTLRWRRSTGWGIDATPALDDRHVYVGSMDNTLYALLRDSGKQVWAFTCASSIQSSPVVYGDYVIFGADDGYLYALNTTSGDPGWSFAPAHTTERTVYNYVTTPVSSPAVSNQTVFVGAGGTIYALDAQTVERPPREESGSGGPSALWLGMGAVVAGVLVAGGYWYYRKRMAPPA